VPTTNKWTDATDDAWEQDPRSQRRVRTTRLDKLMRLIAVISLTFVIGSVIVLLLVVFLPK
jgi:hypothetical protein